MLDRQHRMVDGIMSSAGIEGAGIGEEGFGFQSQQFPDKALDTAGLYIGIVSGFADMNLYGGKIIFLKTGGKAARLKQHRRLLRDYILAVIDRGLNKIHLGSHKITTLDKEKPHTKLALRIILFQPANASTYAESKCSITIFIPRPISISPPRASILFSKKCPNLAPI